MSGRGLLSELRSWARFLLPSKYVAVYYPTALSLARHMLQVAHVTSDDFVVDLVSPRARQPHSMGGMLRSGGRPGAHRRGA
jgi:hypothetical protein